jgi:hypothetical protein
MQAVVTRAGSARPARSTLWFAGAAGAFFTAMLIAGLVLDGAVSSSTGGAPVIGLDTLSADLGRAHGSHVWPVEAWVYTLAAVPFVFFVAGLRRALAGAGHAVLADAGAVAALLFMVLHTVHNLALLAVVQFLAPHYTAGAADSTAIEATARGLIGFGDAAFLPGGGVGSILLVGAMVVFARVQSGWASRLAIAAAALVTVGYLQYAAGPALFVALGGWVAFIAWSAVSSAGLLRRGG